MTEYQDDNRLSLPEELMLLALRDEEGTVVSSASMVLPYGLAGAILLELVLHDRLDFQGKYLHIASAVKTGDPLLDKALTWIEQRMKPRDAMYWIGILARKMHPLHELYQDRLIEKGILRREEKKVLWVFTTKRYPTEDAGPEAGVRERVRDVVLKDSDCDDRTGALICLVHACDLAGEIFEKPELKVAKSRLKKLSEDSRIGGAIKDTVAAIQVALMATIISSTATTTVIASS